MSNKNVWNYLKAPDGVIERNIFIKAKKDGRPIRIAQLTDLHFNYCNQKDIEENDPVLMSTYANREWLKNGSSVENAKRSLERVKDADAIVITGDILDYLSHGCEELATKHIFAPYPNVIASLGNHEAARKVQGKFNEVMPYCEKAKWLRSFWPNDILYSSKVIDGRVMIIQMDNCSHGDCFYGEQIEPFTRDIELARENGYTVLLFFHINIATKNKSDECVVADMIGDASCKIINLCERGIKEETNEASKTICEIIRTNADIISACFCGHLHCDLYCEIEAKTKDGTKKNIPQYVLIGTPYGDGHILNITVT